MNGNWQKIEDKWQKVWSKKNIFKANLNINKKKFFVTFPYPYMNGPLHLGHGYTSTRVDVYARFKRMKGYNTLFPWAWHWTGESIVGTSLRIQKGDQNIIRALIEVDGVSNEEIKNFVDPIYMANYYTREGKEVLKRLGHSIDWSREFHTTYLEPTYSRFIEWQYETLRKKGYVSKGTHPVVWCPNCESPTGDHDRLEGEGVSPEEYILIKFRLKNFFLPAATYRPETIYGVTNIFINPESIYVEAQVDNENWIISENAAIKLSGQLKKVVVNRKFKGEKLLGNFFIDPISGRELPILPAKFVKPDSGTGIVYSVPAHAPADWVALQDLVNNSSDLKKFGINVDIVKNIKPISLIKIEGYKDFPAVEIVKKLKIQNQFDPKLDFATSEIYKKEYHTGILKSNCGKYAGKNVQDVKEQIIKDFKKANIVDLMYDMTKKVICKCTTECYVKILSNQWFICYSNKDWKKKVHETLDNMLIYPENAREYFHDRVDWLKDWACTRKTGLGTPLPWDKSWIIETLSDSTIYMSYYPIVPYIRKYDIKSNQMTNEVFDYIFLNKGNVKNISNNSDIKLAVLRKMRKEFTYWYPLDFRNSAKELIPNHLSFFIFQHVAIFPKKFYPKSIGVNGMLKIEGEKMSKSKGNFLTLRQTIDKYGADATRLTLLLATENMDDPDWREENAQIISQKIKTLYHFINEIQLNLKNFEIQSIDNWIESRIQRKINKITEAICNLETRTASELAFFEIWNDVKWYLRRTNQKCSKILKNIINKWILLLAPFAPYLAEELWNLTGNEKFASTANWPSYQSSKINLLSEKMEELIQNILSDTLNIIKVTKISPKKIYFYTAASWKWNIFMKTLEKSLLNNIELNQIIKELMKKELFKKDIKKYINFLKEIFNDLKKLRKFEKKQLLNLNEFNEEKNLSNVIPFLQKELKANIYVYNEENKEIYDPKKRAPSAKPYRPAIYIE